MEGSIADRVKAVIAREGGVDPASLTSETGFGPEGLNLDSLTRVELVMGLDEEFDISIPEEDAEKINSVGAAIAAIEAVLAAKGSA